MTDFFEDYFIFCWISICSQIYPIFMIGASSSKVLQKNADYIKLIKCIYTLQLLMSWHINMLILLLNFQLQFLYPEYLRHERIVNVQQPNQITEIEIPVYKQHGQDLGVHVQRDLK